MHSIHKYNVQLFTNAAYLQIVEVCLFLPAIRKRIEHNFFFFMCDLKFLIYSNANREKNILKAMVRIESDNIRVS